MSLEQMGDHITNKTTVKDMQQMGDSPYDRELVLSNLMQVQLASVHEEDFGEFLDKHGNDFRLAVTENPSLLTKFEQDPESALSEISAIIYH